MNFGASRFAQKNNTFGLNDVALLSEVQWTKTCQRCAEGSQCSKTAIRIFSGGFNPQVQILRKSRFGVPDDGIPTHDQKPNLELVHKLQ